MMTPRLQKGLTLIELTLVITVILVLMSISVYSTGAYTDWQKGRAASETLRKVYVAQRLYLADKPNTVVANLTSDDLLPYLLDSSDEFPTIEDLDGNPLTISVSVTPPVALSSGGSLYDPSGSTTDSLWDIGEY